MEVIYKLLALPALSPGKQPTGPIKLQAASVPGPIYKFLRRKALLPMLEIGPWFTQPVAGSYT
jgi:hypothetical protein